MKYIIALFSFLFCNVQLLLAQSINIFSEPTHLRSAIVYEDSIGSINKGFKYLGYNLDAEFIDIVKNRNQNILIFSRKQKDFFPNLYTWYFFDDDSLVTEVIYNWGFYNLDFNPSENLKILQLESTRRDEYLQQYNKVKELLIKLIGKATSESSYKNSAKSVWGSEKYKIFLTMNFDPSLDKFAGTNFWRGGHSEVKIHVFYK